MTSSALSSFVQGSAADGDGSSSSIAVSFANAEQAELTTTFLAIDVVCDELRCAVRTAVGGGRS